jgi:hypothetical protein
MDTHSIENQTILFAVVQYLNELKKDPEIEEGIDVAMQCIR